MSECKHQPACPCGAEVERLTREVKGLEGKIVHNLETERALDEARASLARVTEERDEARERNVHTREVLAAVRLVLASHRTYPQPACGCETCATLGRALEMHEARQPTAGLRNYGDEIDAARAEVARLRVEAGEREKVVEAARAAMEWSPVVPGYAALRTALEGLRSPETKP